MSKLSEQVQGLVAGFTANLTQVAAHADVDSKGRLIEHESYASRIASITADLQRIQSTGVRTNMTMESVAQRLAAVLVDGGTMSQRMNEGHVYRTKALVEIGQNAAKALEHVGAAVAELSQTLETRTAERDAALRLLAETRAKVEEQAKLINHHPSYGRR